MTKAKNQTMRKSGSKQKDQEESEISKYTSEEDEIQWEERSATSVSSVLKDVPKRDSWMLAPPSQTSDVLGTERKPLTHTERTSRTNVNVEIRSEIAEHSAKNQLPATSSRSNRLDLPKDRNHRPETSEQNWSVRQLELLYDRADREGRSIEEIALERWGSLTQLRALTADAKGKIFNHPQQIIPTAEMDKSCDSLDMEENKRIPDVLITKEPENNAKKIKVMQDEVTMDSSKMMEGNLNNLAAKMIKAELAGDMKTKAYLETLLKTEKSRILSSTASLSTTTKKDDEARTESHLIPHLDALGHVQDWNIPSSSNTISSEIRNVPMFDRQGRRLRYSKDDDEETLATMVRKEHVSRGNFDKEYASNISRQKNFDTNLELMDDLADSLAEKPSNKETRSDWDEKQRQRAIQEVRKVEKLQDSCWFCFSNPKIAKHLIVSIATKTYLALPQRGALAEDHCMILPTDHALSTLQTDEQVWEEIRNYKKCLIRMFHAVQKSVVFLETAFHFSKQRHIYVDCIPLPLELAQDAPMYFKKAIDESESEWCQNLKLIDTSGKGLQRSIPKHFPYFYVEFGLDSGFAHVIEDEKEFPRTFGKEILSGILELPPDVWKRPKKDTYEQDQNRARSFATRWDKYDWTKLLS